jgi:hypothetical protein
MDSTLPLNQKMVEYRTLLFWVFEIQRGSIRLEPLEQKNGAP